MTGRHKFSDLEAKLPRQRRARVERATAKLRKAMDLAQLRIARELSQVEMGKRLKVEQPAIAKLEKRTDMYVSTLRRFIEAAGGKLEIVARFPHHKVFINNFGKIEND